MLLNKPTLTASFKYFFSFSEIPGVENIKIIVILPFNLRCGRAASIVKNRNFFCFSFFSCSPKALAYGMVFFFQFQSLKAYSLLEGWFVLPLYTGKLFTVAVLNLS